MKAKDAFDGQAFGDLSSAVLAIGQSAFPNVLLAVLKRVAEVGHCMVFTFDGERSSRCLLDVGNIPTGPDLGSAYSEHFHLADPNRDAIFQDRRRKSPIILPTFAPTMYNASYHKLFFEEAAIIDKFATAVWVAETCYYVNFYRTVPQGRFYPDQSARLKTLAPIIGAAVARHFQETPAPYSNDPLRRLETIFATNTQLSCLTKREKEVCLRILTGFGSEAISTDLGISLQSTFTYRKRSYQKLAISSQNELFELVLRAVISPNHLN
jgi:DNA-binding CsgD family transcriptional regulator